MEVNKEKISTFASHCSIAGLFITIIPIIISFFSVSTYKITDKTIKDLNIDGVDQQILEKIDLIKDKDPLPEKELFYYLDKVLKDVPNITFKQYKKISDKSLESNLLNHYIKKNEVFLYFINLASAIILSILGFGITKKHKKLEADYSMMEKSHSNLEENKSNIERSFIELQEERERLSKQHADLNNNHSILVKDYSELKEEQSTLETSINELEKEHSGLSNRHIQLEENLKRCNILNVVPKLTGTECSIENIKKYIIEYNIKTFRLTGMFAHKWIGEKSDADEFEQFLSNMRNKHKNFRVRFLLTSPVSESVKEEFDKCGRYKDDGSTDQFFKKCLFDYKFLAKMEGKFPDSFQCRISDSPPIFRYRQIGNSIFVSDYCLAKDLGKGDDRPHIEFTDSEKVSGGRRCMYHAFEELYDYKWQNSSTPIREYLQNMTTAGHLT